jgi:putative FmdB family regulatory protein
MPTYTYKREDGSVFDIEQRITEPALAACPTTGQKVKRIITGAGGLVFKGSGFYLTDYARNGGSEGKSKPTTDAPADKPAEKAAESKPAPAPAASSPPSE